MSETIPKRVTRLLSSSLHGVLNNLENANPELVLEEALREIDRAVDETRAELGRQIAQTHLIGKQITTETKRYVDLKDKIHFAALQNRDDLAEAGISEQMDIELRLPVLEEGLGKAQKRSAELESYINALIAKKRDLKLEMQSFLSLAPSPRDSGNPGQRGAEQRVRDAEQTFERVIEKNLGIAAGSRRELDAQRQLSELDALVRSNRVAERLAALKAGRD